MSSAEDQKNVGFSRNAYVLAVVCLLLGLPIGYFARGLKTSEPVASTRAVETSQAQSAPDESTRPTVEQMKHMADKQAEPLLKQLESKPNDPQLLAQVAQMYFSAHQFDEAVAYAQRAVDADPRHVGNRADLASYLYYSDHVDQAIATMEEALKIDPKNPQVLWNLGVFRWKGKDDPKGAVKLWNQLLASNPKLPQDRKQQVQKAIAAAKETPKYAAAIR